MHIFCVPQRVHAISARVQVAKSCMRRAPKYGDVNILGQAYALFGHLDP